VVPAAEAAKGTARDATRATGRDAAKPAVRTAAARRPDLIDHDHERSDITMSDQSKSVRIAIPSELPGGLEARRSGHFGRCACFTLVDVADGSVDQVQVLTNAPHTEGGCMTPVMTLAEHMVDAIVVDGIGGRPLMGFNQVGIEVYYGGGAQTVGDAVRDLLAGRLPQFRQENTCGGGADHHCQGSH